MLLSRLLFTTAVPRLTVVTLPSALGVSDSCARCTLGVLDTVGAAICWATCPSIVRWKVGQGKCAVAGTRRLAMVHATSRSELCRYNSAFAVVVERLVLLAADPEMM
jgi:hypothetical protein